jgi:hypothetical protein
MNGDEMTTADELLRAIYLRDKRDPMTPERREWRWGRDYGKDLLADINQLAHERGTDGLMRDCLQRAYTEIKRLREKELILINHRLHGCELPPLTKG